MLHLLFLVINVACLLLIYRKVNLGEGEISVCRVGGAGKTVTVIKVGSIVSWSKTNPIVLELDNGRNESINWSSFSPKDQKSLINFFVDKGIPITS